MKLSPGSQTDWEAVKRQHGYDLGFAHRRRHCGRQSIGVQVRDLATFLKRHGHWQLIADRSAS